MTVPRQPTRYDYERRALLERVATVRSLTPTESEILRVLRELDAAWDAHTRARSQARRENAR